MSIDVSFDKAGNISRLGTLADHLTESHILNAIAEYHKLHECVETYDDSTIYDLVVENKLYPPKAIFGLAMSELLGMRVKSSHFSEGLRSANFLTLERLGFEVRLKDGSP